MLHRCFQKMQSLYRNPVEGEHRLYTLGPLEITLIVVAVILVFGVGKLANVGGALGKSIREFRRERDRKDDDVPQVTTTEPKGNKAVAQLEAKPGTEKACPSCGQKMPHNAKFCMACGAKAEEVCPSCGATMPENATFCMGCGAKMQGHG